MKQQTIIIIGATSGIGKTLFEKYAADGNRIGIVGRRTHLLDELRQEHPDMTVTATADKGHGDRYEVNLSPMILCQTRHKRPTLKKHTNVPF